MPIGDKSADFHNGLAVVEGLRGQINSRRSIIEGGDTDLIGDDQIHRPIDSAIEVKIAKERRNIFPAGVVDLHAELVFIAELEVVGQFKAKSGESSPMLPDEGIVKVNSSHEAGGLKTDEDTAFPLPILGNFKLTRVPASPFIKTLFCMRILGFAGFDLSHPDLGGGSGLFRSFLFAADFSRPCLTVQCVPGVRYRDSFPLFRICIQIDILPNKLPVLRQGLNLPFGMKGRNCDEKSEQEATDHFFTGTGSRSFDHFSEPEVWDSSQKRADNSLSESLVRLDGVGPER